jgi:RNA polymerase sigma-70 factor (ECF subfamily)
MNATNPFPDPDDSPSGGDAASLRDERFLALYNVAYPRLYAFILSLVPNRNDANDTLQDTSVVLLRRFGDFHFSPNSAEDETEVFIRWGCGIALNHVRRLRRQRASMLQFSDQVLERIAVARQEHSALLESRRRFLPECLGKLAESDRELVSRCFRQTISIQAVAGQLGRPVNTLYKALTRIRAKLKECIDLAVRREDRA